MNTEFDLIVIGGGPGGYEAAIRAAQLGMKVACIEKRLLADKPSLGGTCLNVGCIPSKALLDSSHRLHETQHELEVHGISTGPVAIDIGVMQARKNKVVEQLTGGIAQLFKGHNITWLQGSGRLQANRVVEFTGFDGSITQYKAANIVLAAGSEPVHIAAAPIDNQWIVDSTGALAFDEVPKKLAVIGAGVIGLELGSVWQRLGAQVDLYEAATDFLPMLDRLTAKEAQKIFKKQGLNILLSCKVDQAQVKGKQVELSYTQQEQSSTVVYDKVILAVGRKPSTAGLLAHDSGVTLDARGFIEVNDYCLTSVAGVWAIGDCVRGPMLAHKAMEEGVMVVERINGEATQVNYDTIISVIYTSPEIAWVGLSEEQAMTSGVKVKTGQFPFAVNGRALAANQTQGFVKFVADEQSDRLLGMSVIGGSAGELVHQGMIALEFHSSIEDLQLMTFAHPTVSEVVHEAALSVDGRAIHAIQRKRR